LSLSIKKLPLKHSPLTIVSLSIALVFLLSGCIPNNPYRDSEAEENIYYTTFDEPPKYLDPARSYFASELRILAQIYEPLLQYHYLRRPYELTPLTARAMPRVSYFDDTGRSLPPDAAPAKVARAVYEINIKEDILYQDHPAFAKDSKGNALYSELDKNALKGINGIEDFAKTGTKTLTSDDYIYQIKRLADPELHCPILPILEKYILGLEEYSTALKAALEEERQRRKALAGAAYSRALDEKTNPIILDYDKYPLPGVLKVDENNFRIILKKKYPQFIYWLAMPFFSPFPKEADIFYKQGALMEKNIGINRFPIGTGAYQMNSFKAESEITLVKNKNYRYEAYPSDGEPMDEALGLLKTAGEAMPFIDKITFKLEKETIPRWNKFLQGYYDSSGISSDSFDSAISMSGGGGVELTKAMQEKGISLITSVEQTTYYTGFNMLDDVVGGYGTKNEKLRQAISIILNYEEFIEIFSNGRGVAAMSPLPPGIFGHITGKDGINPYVYDWDEETNRARRKSIDEAQRLMVLAGYPNGLDKDGRPLVIHFDNAWTHAGAKQMINWYTKRFKLLGIQLENRTTDYNRYQEKMASGNIQFFFLGWNADYPDPENFYFLLYGPNSKVYNHGENQANYNSPEFDRLFREMENMDNTEERLSIIKEMTRTLQRDAPWVWSYHPVAFSLAHEWIGNRKANSMANNTIKYITLDAKKRAEQRRSWNKPRLWPLLVFVLIISAAAVPALLTLRRRFGMGGKG
jgi:ABC-type transport system substrate-binding protein